MYPSASYILNENFKILKVQMNGLRVLVSSFLFINEKTHHFQFYEELLACFVV